LREIEKIKITKSVEKSLVFFSRYLALMRATASIDSYTGELRNIVYPEKPTRCLKQLKRLFICLKSLDNKYSDKKALRVIREVVYSSISPVRRKIFTRLLIENDWITEYQLAEQLRLGRKTVYSELNILWNLGIVNMEPRIMGDKHWKINKQNEIVKESVAMASPLNNI